MRRMAMLVTVAAMVAVPAAASAADDQDAVYQQYGNLVIQLRDCNLDRAGWDQLSDERRADCDNLFRDYVLFADSTQSETYYVHCRSASKCIQTPDGKPAANGPIPAGSTVYDTKPRSTRTSAKAAKHKKRHRRHHA